MTKTCWILLMPAAASPDPASPPSCEAPLSTAASALLALSAADPSAGPASAETSGPASVPGVTGGLVLSSPEQCTSATAHNGRRLPRIVKRRTMEAICVPWFTPGPLPGEAGYPGVAGHQSGDKYVTIA